MTGFGEAHQHEDGVTVGIELRTINSRFFKLTVKCPEAYAGLESEIEGLVRRQVRRGTVQVTLRIERPESPEGYRLNEGVLAAYRRQLEGLYERWHLTGSIAPESLLTLPGVVHESLWAGTDAGLDWPLISRTLEDALGRLAKMRADEGQAMATELSAHCAMISVELGKVEARVPAVVQSFRDRLEERLKKVLAEHDVALDAADVLREVSIFAERSDISEEIVRLRSHLEQFAHFMQEGESTGRKLDFLTQEMFREVNTIGAKANDVTISRHVIEMKAAIEKIREMIQNVE